MKIKRDRCAQGAARRARLALEHDESLDYDQLEGEWLGYAALIVQVERIVADLERATPRLTSPTRGGTRGGTSRLRLDP